MNIVCNLLFVTTFGTVAVGTPITGRPPHRSLHVELPHRAPTLGFDDFRHSYLF